MRTGKEWMREDTWHFEVEVLRIYGRQELWSHGLAHARFQTAPTSLLTLQTCGGGLRLGRVKIMNSRSGTDACIGRAGPFLLVAGRKPLRGHTWHQWRPGGTAQGRAVLVLARPVWGKLALRLWYPSISWAHGRSTRLVRLSATVRLHALVGKKDGHTFTTNEELKLDCQDLSELVLTRCRLFKCLCDYMLSAVKEWHEHGWPPHLPSQHPIVQPKSELSSNLVRWLTANLMRFGSNGPLPCL
ncbi:hypothetical protein THAOC_27948 [Thalassiosira oceanica]|uniref:DUF6743 domain-containing protein n=1 Tax=Thalassiosira oceanica TaxID=159749 RepID=K0RGC5_THAOC|nr:hypothetical protein THAOC_27948 [Thalassiosira oceanica]|eukprot:EJK52748.1 hypothetical protein THAOC_27948 [Thalassiosira oceanica]